MKNIKCWIGITAVLIIVLLFFILYITQRRIKPQNKGAEKNIGGFQPNIDFEAKAKVDKFINEGVPFLGQSVGISKEQIITNLGDAVNIKEAKVKNIHNPEILDTVYDIFYDGLYIKLYQAQHKGFIEHISLTNNSYNLKFGIKVGDIKEKVANILGNPSEENDNMWTYIYSDGYPDTVKFYFKGDIIYKIEWDFWID